MIGWENIKHMHVFFDKFLYFNMKLIIQFFQAIFHSSYITLASQ